jgi:hypothetical protein
MTEFDAADWFYVGERPASEQETPIPHAIVVGREGADVVLDDPEVSRRHARLIPVLAGDLVVEDLDARNGTWVNEQRVQGTRTLVDGDRVRFGRTVWRIRHRAAATRVADRAPGGPAHTAVAAPVPESATASGALGLTTEAPAATAPDRRGDVPAPEAMPSVVRRSLPVAPERGSGFRPAEPRRSGRSAARRLDVTLASYLVILLTAGALIVYFVTR